MTKEEAVLIVDEFKALGGAFVEDEYYIDDDGVELYNPNVDRMNAESWLLSILMKLHAK